jgi:hypothetical protein
MIPHHLAALFADHFAAGRAGQIKLIYRYFHLLDPK